MILAKAVNVIEWDWTSDIDIEYQDNQSKASFFQKGFGQHSNEEALHFALSEDEG